MPVLVYDEFDPPLGELNGRTPNVGAAWAGVNSEFAVISGGYVARSEGQDGAKSIITGAVGDLTLTLTDTVIRTGPVGSRASLGGILRYSNASNFWLLRPWSDTLQLVQVEGGVLTVRGSGGTIATETQVAIAVRAVGPDFECFLDGVSQFTHSSAFNQQATTVGIYLTKVGETSPNQASLGAFLATSPDLGQLWRLGELLVRGERDVWRRNL